MNPLRHWFACLLCIAVGCAGLRPGEHEPVVSRIKPDFRVEGRPVILILLDGCRADVLYEMLDAGRLPNIRRYVADRGVRVERAFASLTSTTFAAVSAQLSGKIPAHLNFPGNAWFDRESCLLRKINSQASVTRINTDITGPTLAEIIAKAHPNGWSAIIADTLTRGAQYSNPMREWLGICYFLQRWRIVDRFSLETLHDLLGEANRRGVFPAFTFIHLIATDNSGHLFGPRSEDLRQCLQHEDRQLGRLGRTLETLGLLDKVCLVLSADHGMMELAPGQSLVIHEFLSQEVGLRCAHEAVEEETRPEKRAAWFRQFRAIETTSGDRYCFVYLSNPLNDPPGRGDWASRPRFEDLRRIRTDTGQSVDLVEVLRKQPAVGLLCAKDGQGTCRVFSREGEGVIRVREHEGARQYAYEVSRGRDPLGYGNLLRGFHPAEEWFAASCDTAYPNFVPESYDLFDSPRTGDLVLFAAPGWNFKPKCAGAHGGPHFDELRIPLLLAGPGIRQGVIRRARAVDLAPTFLAYMGIRTEVSCDGRSLLEELEKSVER